MEDFMLGWFDIDLTWLAKDAELPTKMRWALHAVPCMASWPRKKGLLSPRSGGRSAQLRWMTTGPEACSLRQTPWVAQIVAKGAQQLHRGGGGYCDSSCSRVDDAGLFVDETVARHLWCVEGEVRCG